jgi:hypothetical protein
MCASWVLAFPPRMGRLLVARGGSLGCNTAPTICCPPWRAANSKIHQISNLLDRYLLRSRCTSPRVLCVFKRQRKTQKTPTFAKSRKLKAKRSPNDDLLRKTIRNPPHSTTSKPSPGSFSTSPSPKIPFPKYILASDSPVNSGNWNVAGLGARFATSQIGLPRY